MLRSYLRDPRTLARCYTALRVSSCHNHLLLPELPAGPIVIIGGYILQAFYHSRSSSRCYSIDAADIGVLAGEGGML